MSTSFIPLNLERFLDVTAQREQVVSANMANANTPGYSREIVNLSSAGSTQVGNVAIGNGVSIDSITSVRDQLIGLRIQQQTSQQTAASAQSSALASAQTYFSGTSGTIGTDLSAFFTSLSALSSAPSNAAARQTAISDAQDLVSTFNNASNGLTSTQSGLNTQVSGDVTQINALASQIAVLNTQVSQSIALGQDGGTALDQRDTLEQQLAGLTSISITTTAQGDTIATGTGTALVVAGQSLALSATTGSNGLTQVTDSAGTNITKTLTGGDLGGILQARDTTIAGLLAQLDTLASDFANAINSAQTKGFDLSKTPGGPLFTVPATVTGAAGSIALATTDGSAIAISSAGSAGSNGNLSTLTDVQTNALAGGLSPTDSYAALVDLVGNAVSQANTQATSLQTSLTQLGNQQSAVSGVSIDEESSNLIRYQQAYEAAAEVVTTIRSLFTATLTMITGT